MKKIRKICNVPLGIILSCEKNLKCLLFLILILYILTFSDAKADPKTCEDEAEDADEDGEGGSKAEGGEEGGKAAPPRLRHPAPHRQARELQINIG